ncbi:MAG TPA: glycoside hydrolase family 6 protein [Mycobacteriales bacterium]|nr:glycoside hydrolase family 6 protein [Mycobacteriales bacterium]HWA66451.1 glycoside hydrolase family 6 protein [Mycobacteriales bacterium]
MPKVSSFVRRCAVAGAALAATAALTVPALPAANATAANPVAGVPWGIYEGNGDGLWPAYESSTGTDRALLAKEALNPRVRSYGSWIPTNQVAGIISKDIAQEQAGNPSTLVWMELFRLYPHEEANNRQPLSSADQQAYRDWINAAIQGIGSAKVGIVLEPDLPLTLVSWGPKVRAALTRYAAQQLAAVPNATTYIDGGSADWLSVPALTKLLISAGIQYARGFNLGASHHVATASEIRYCAAVGRALARRGFPDKRCVIDTSDNGHPYTNKQFYAKYPRATHNANNPPTCRTKTQRVCVALGIPPTTDVTNPRWKLPAPVDKLAATWVDAYVWDGHPWKINNGHDFDMSAALNAARTDPFF